MKKLWLNFDDYAEPGTRTHARLSAWLAKYATTESEVAVLLAATDYAGTNALTKELAHSALGLPFDTMKTSH